MEEQRNDYNDLSNDEKFKKLATDLPANLKWITEGYDKIVKHIDDVESGDEEFDAFEMRMRVSELKIGANNFVNAYIKLANDFDEQIDKRQHIIDEKTDIIKQYERIVDSNKELLDERLEIINQQNEIIKKLQAEIDAYK